MSGGEEMTSQRRGGAGGKQTDHETETGTETETEVETDNENETHYPPSKLRDSSMMSGAGKTVRGVKKTKKRILNPQMPLPLRKRNPALNCQGHLQKIQTHSGAW